MQEVPGSKPGGTQLEELNFRIDRIQENIIIIKFQKTHKTNKKGKKKKKEREGRKSGRRDRRRRRTGN